MKKLSVLFIAVFILSTPFMALAADPTPVPATPTTGSSGVSPFYKLTNLPGLEDLSNSSSSNFPTFVNTLYKVCIGVAATLAVIMIMYAGIKFMTNTGSVSSNEEAKSYLQNAILGLVLVLSPAIVFGIINPQILDLKLNFSSLQPKDISSAGTDGSVVKDDGSCTPACKSGTSCQKGSCVAATTGNENQCNANYTPDGYANLAGKSCSDQFGAGSTAVAYTCCTEGQLNGFTCCAKPNSVSAPTGGGNGAATVSTWGWRAAVVKGNTNTPIQDGPFLTQKECQDDQNKAIEKSGVGTTYDFQCNCDKPLSQQTDCSF